MSPKVSVVIPTYNNASFLKKAILSVINQTFQDFEIIVVDNHSVDNTEEIIRSFKNKRIKFVKIRNEGVVSKSRNLGIKKSSAPWIAFLDSDDIWYPKKLEACLNVLKKDTNAILVCHSMHILKDNKMIRVSPYSSYNKSMFKDLLFGVNPLFLSSVMVKRSVLTATNGFSERRDFMTVEDYELWIRLAKIGKFSTIQKELGIYVMHKRNLSNNIKKQTLNERNVINHHLSLLKNKNDEQVKKRYARLYFRAGWAFYKEQQFNESIIWYLKAARVDPFYYNIYIAFPFSLLKSGLLSKVIDKLGSRFSFVRF